MVLSAAPPKVYRRDFSNGIVLLNGESTPQTVTLESGFQRFKGTQAPLYQYTVDDSDTGFSDTGSWNVVTYNTGAYSSAGSGPNLPAEPQNQNGPYYHCWKGICHELDTGTGTAQWNLNIPADGQYTIKVWLPAAPSASTWTKDAIYQIVSGGNVVASATLDQSTASAGDGLHMIATVNLTAAGAPFLQVQNGGAGPLIADAVYVTSAVLYNDGSPASQVTVSAFDAILLQRQQPAPLPTSQVNSVLNAASYEPAIASGGFVAIAGTGFGTAMRSWTSSDFSGTNLPTSLDGISVTIDDLPAYVEYISPTQINVIAPDDDTIGQVQVQVTTPQGASYSGTVLKQKLSPAFFTYQSGTASYVAAVHLDGTLVGPAGPSSRPAVPGEVIEIYGTGFGPTNPASPTAELVSQPAPISFAAAVTIGGVNAEVQWAGLVSSGLYQLNVQIPNLAAGDQPVQTSVSGFQSVANAFLAVAQQ
ncbi:MAG TPA: IPT/TIG domain-containing protein [Bryobacteraceae bacterium]|nr:IPT/TIG domain-containing protein [Bryobacteraceae bacterium]